MSIALLAGELAIIAGAMVMVGLTIALWARLRHLGGLELALAHVVADPRRRRAFLWTVGVSFGGFVWAGIAAALSDIFSWGSAGAFGVALLFLLGSAGILLLITDALRASPLSLQEEWNLVEEAARASARRSPPPSDQGRPG